MTIYSSCDCSLLNEASFNYGMSPLPNPPNFTGTASNWKIKGYTFPTAGLPSNSHALNPDFPTSSPWVTSVGATGVAYTNKALTPNASVVLSVWNGGSITGGGGFSSIDARPGYQDAAISAWLKKSESQLTSLTDRPQHSRTNRGYPDVSMVGHQFLTVSENTPASAP